MTMTHSNGICNKVDGNGNFIVFNMQPNSDRSARLMEAIGLNQHHSLDKKETHRMIAGRGVVTIFFQDGTFLVMHPSGFMELSCKGDYYYATYPNGYRYLVQPRQGEKKLDQKISTTTAVDPETGIICTSRGDHLRIFKYTDGTRLTSFVDGTTIWSNKERCQFVVRHPSHSDVSIQYDYFRARNPSVIGLGSSFATKGRDNLFERTYDGRLMTINCDDGNTIKIFKEMRELGGYNSFRLVTVTIFETATQKVIKHENYGEVVFIDKRDSRPTAQGIDEVGELVAALKTRTNLDWKTLEQISKLNIDASMKRSLNYFIQLFLPVNERQGGVYTVDIFKGEILIRDNEGNEFLVDKEGKMSSKISISFNLNSKKSAWDKFPHFEGKEYIDPANLDLPVPKEWNPPALVVIDRSGEATVLYDQKMLTDYFEDKLTQQSFALTSQDQTNASGGITVISCVKSTCSSKVAAFEMPSIFRGLPQTNPPLSKPSVESIVVRQFKTLKDFDTTDDGVVQASKAKSEAWHADRHNHRVMSEIFKSSSEEKAIELEFQQRLLVLAKDEKNILVYGQTNKIEISNTSNVIFADS